MVFKFSRRENVISPPSTNYNYLYFLCKRIMAKLFDLDKIQEAAQRLLAGQLVAFPTQTVYGLGANAFRQLQVKKIFTVKKRPLTDPIIVHVADKTQAKSLIYLDAQSEKIFGLLAQKFWPGPLTIVAPGNWSILPRILGGGTQMVGVRVPNHPIALDLIRISKVPIAAPSANLFGHVSPTSHDHVLDDFRHESEVNIIKGGNCCAFGVQSTVVKLVKIQTQVELHILREGGLTKKNLEQQMGSQIAVRKGQRVLREDQHMQAPGQLLKHYSPFVPCYIYDSSAQLILKASDVILLDFSDRKFQFKTASRIQVGRHFQINQKQELQRSWMRQLYAALRLAEKQAFSILLHWPHQQTGCIWDKLFRATQGKAASLRD